MDNESYQILLKGLFRSIMEITKKKAHDYAEDTDTLSNFKRQAEMRKARGADNLPSDVAYDFVLTKLARLGNLRGKSPKNEAVEDSVLDAINYLGLYYACKIEEKT